MTEMYSFVTEEHIECVCHLVAIFGTAPKQVLTSYIFFYHIKSLNTTYGLNIIATLE